MRRARGWQPQRAGFSKHSLGKYRDGRNKQIGPGFEPGKSPKLLKTFDCGTP
jgi:hypothetical protein